MVSPPADMRVAYDRGGLDEAGAADDPFRQFDRWFEDARAAGLHEPNAMTLATADSAGRPSARMVLLKGFDAAGFVFFSNYESRKADELAANPDAALLFWWDKLHRQVRIEGRVTKADAAEADAYYASRPYGSRIGALASPQSQPLASREELEARERHFRALYPEGGPVPRPEHWGGFRLVPRTFEFWQGRPSRLHDRLRYRREDDETWTRDRLAP